MQKSASYELQTQYHLVTSEKYAPFTRFCLVARRFGSITDKPHVGPTNLHRNTTKAPVAVPLNIMRGLSDNVSSPVDFINPSESMESIIKPVISAPGKSKCWTDDNRDPETGEGSACSVCVCIVM